MAYVSTSFPHFHNGYGVARALSAAQLCSVVVFGCIVDKCRPDNYCVFNDGGGCVLGVWLSVLSLVTIALFALRRAFDLQLGRLSTFVFP